MSKEQKESNSTEQMEDWDVAKGRGRRIFRLDFPINKYQGRILVPEFCFFFLRICFSTSVP